MAVRRQRFEHLLQDSPRVGALDEPMGVVDDPDELAQPAAQLERILVGLGEAQEQIDAQLLDPVLVHRLREQRRLPKPAPASITVSRAVS